MSPRSEALHGYSVGQANALPGRRMFRTATVAISVSVVAANLTGAVIVLALLLLVIPLPPELASANDPWLYVVVAAAYVAFAVPVGIVLGLRDQWEMRAWLREGRPATEAEQLAVLRTPTRLFWLQMSLWLGAAVLFTLLTADASLFGAFWVGLTVALTGLTTAASALLMVERLLRPVAARALANGFPREQALPGVAFRALAAWMVGTGVPLAGIVLVGVVALANEDATRHRLAIAMVVLAGTAITIGLGTVIGAAHATSDPIEGVAQALGRVQGGDFTGRIAVYDGTEIGRLQNGFNEMVAGLAERERIREAFGTYVDPAVAEHVLRAGVDLAGEEVEVTAMFVDIRSFTAYAEQTPAAEVVATLNALFSLAVPAVRAQGGHVDKFVGDGFLAVFGAPNRLENHARAALRAALEVEREVRQRFTQISVGIGLNSGVVIAGNVGGAGRLEFSVIGDAVNVAARVEAATRQTGDRILLAERTRELLGEWPGLVERRDISLKGKTGTVTLFAPSSASPAG